MSLITIEQFYEFEEDYPELAQLIHINNDAESFIDDTSGD